MRRNVIVEDDVDVRDVEASAGDVGGDEDAPALGFKLVERAEPLVLEAIV